MKKQWMKRTKDNFPEPEVLTPLKLDNKKWHITSEESDTIILEGYCEDSYGRGYNIIVPDRGWVRFGKLPVLEWFGYPRVYID